MASPDWNGGHHGFQAGAPNPRRCEREQIRDFAPRQARASVRELRSLVAIREMHLASSPIHNEARAGATTSRSAFESGEVDESKDCHGNDHDAYRRMQTEAGRCHGVRVRAHARWSGGPAPRLYVRRHTSQRSARTFPARGVGRAMAEAADPPPRASDAESTF